MEASLNALRGSRGTPIYKRQRSDGTIEELSEGQIVAEVLKNLRREMQLVVGLAVAVKELRQFLEKNEIDP